MKRERREEESESAKVKRAKGRCDRAFEVSKFKKTGLFLLFIAYFSLVSHLQAPALPLPELRHTPSPEKLPMTRTMKEPIECAFIYGELKAPAFWAATS